MGYISRVTGRIVVDPPIPVFDIENPRYLPDVANKYGPTSQIPNVLFVVEERPVEEIAGAYQRLIVGIEAHELDEFSYYDIENDLADAVRAVIYAGSAVRAGDRLVRIGDEQGDVARYVVSNDDSNPVEVERAALRWPDGSPVTEAQR